jgi:hypothetical protein
MSYEVNFSDAESFSKAKSAVVDDLKALGVTSLDSYKRVKFDEKNHSISFQGSSLELGVLFGNKDSKTSQFIPFNGQHASDAESFSKVSKERGIEGVTVVRTQGNIEDTYKAERDKAVTFFKYTSFQPKQKRGADADSTLDAAVKTNGNIVISEAHGEQAHLRYLIEQMPKMKGGNRSLLLEHFFVDQQPLLDEYMKSPKGSPMPPELAAYVDKFIDPKINGTGNKKGGHVYTTRELLETAKNNGVKVVGIETEESIATRSFAMANKVDSVAKDDAYGLSDRMLLMNYNAAAIAKQLKKENPDTSIVILSGASHGIDYTVEKSSWKDKLKAVPGIGKIFGSPTIFPVDGDSVSNIATEMRKDGIANPSSLQMGRMFTKSDFPIVFDDKGNHQPANLKPITSLIGAECSEKDLGSMRCNLPPLSGAGKNNNSRSCP